MFFFGFSITAKHFDILNILKIEINKQNLAETSIEHSKDNDDTLFVLLFIHLNYNFSVKEYVVSKMKLGQFTALPQVKKCIQMNFARLRRNQNWSESVKKLTQHASIYGMHHNGVR